MINAPVRHQLNKKSYIPPKLTLIKRGGGNLDNILNSEKSDPISENKYKIKKQTRKIKNQISDSDHEPEIKKSKKKLESKKYYDSDSEKKSKKYLESPKKKYHNSKNIKIQNQILDLNQKNQKINPNLITIQMQQLIHKKKRNLKIK